eukprot:TRINITY_DN2864_c0_g1_i3.p1 TRINITY_DN2864_c0_g1~~TRINITY_DN2864_c0_g1_i3.p1  ORF type:complete len:146 (+),score=5.84 TRINITY_DN2864_c0_g1_i3:45-440(+)
MRWPSSTHAAVVLSLTLVASVIGVNGETPCFIDSSLSSRQSYRSLLSPAPSSSYSAPRSLPQNRGEKKLYFYFSFPERAMDYTLEVPRGDDVSVVSWRVVSTPLPQPFIPFTFPFPSLGAVPRWGAAKSNA